MLVSDEERRAILSVADVLVGRAGRTSLVMALRGSRAKRVLQYKVENTGGYGYFAGVAEADVLAKVDELIFGGVLRIDRSGDFPLLAYTEKGLEFAERYVAEEWLSDLRRQVESVAAGSSPELPFLMAKMPDRNLATVGKLIEQMEREVDARWLPLLRQWAASETKRIRGRLNPIISSLEKRPH